MRSSFQFKQAAILTLVNLKSFPKRLMNSTISILSIACVAAVMLSILAMTQGMMKTLQQTGLNNTLLVMRAGAVSELQSVMFPMEVKILKNHPQVLHDSNDQAIVSAEMFVNTIYKPNKEYKPKASTSNEEGQSIALRGINYNTFAFRPHFTLLEGRKFKPGLRELIIGQAIARRMPELTVGSSITLGGSAWTISGIFSDNNSIFESELWADIQVVQSNYQRGSSVQSIRLAMKAETNIEQLKREWHADPRLNIRILNEKQFFADQGQNLTRLVRWIGFPVAAVMAFGAMIAALNTMYATIASRSKEIATQKAMGFSPFAISTAIVIEALLIAMAGAIIGMLPLYLLFDGWTAATRDSNSLSQVMFNFEITTSLLSQTLLFSLVIGLVGGLLPAIKAMRLSVVVGLRE